MAKSNTGSCCGKQAEGSYCKVESLIAVDDRGQMVLPKELRERAESRREINSLSSVLKVRENSAVSP